MKRLVMLVALAFGANVYGFWDAGPAHKYKPCWIPPEEGTPTTRVMSSQALQLQKEFKDRYPEYTLSYDSWGVLNQIKAPANVALSTNPLTTATYTLESLFTEFKDLFGIGTECLSLPSAYKGVSIEPLIYIECIKTDHIPDVSYGGPLVGGYKGTWTLTINYPYQLKDLDLTPAITGTQAVEIAKKDIFDWFNWPGSYKSGFPSKEEYIKRYASGLRWDGSEENLKKYLEKWYERDKASYERRKQLSTQDASQPVSTFSESSQQLLYILIHTNGKPYLAWCVQVGKWRCYIDAKRGKVLYGQCMAKS